MPRETRDALARAARIDVETDWSVARALEHVVKREQRDLLVVGSSRRGPEGCVRIGKRTRQLLCQPELWSLREDAQRAAEGTGASAEVDVVRGRPADALELGEQVDLLAIGSRRWGAAARVLLGSTGEALMRDARCFVMVVPRTDTDNGASGPPTQPSGPG